MYDIIQFIKSSTWFSSHWKFFLDILLAKVALLACLWAILNTVIYFSACIVETKLSRSDGNMHSYEKIFPCLTETKILVSSARGEILVWGGTLSSHILIFVVVENEDYGGIHLIIFLPMPILRFIWTAHQKHQHR